MKIEKGLIFAIQGTLLVVIICFWEAAGRLGWMGIPLFSYPSQLMAFIIGRMSDGTLLPHLVTTLLKTVIGFVLGTICGTGLAAAMWWSGLLAKVLEPLIVTLNGIPKMLLGTLFLLPNGSGSVSVVAMTIWILLVITVRSVYIGFRETDSNYIRVIRIFGGGRKEIFRKVVWPAALPVIVSVITVNSGLAWIAVIVGELLVEERGLGYLLAYGYQTGENIWVLASLFIIALTATVLFKFVSLAGNRFVRKG